MPLRKLIDRSAFPPETLAVIYQAFDLAWAEIAARYQTTDPAALELARNRLAQAVLAEAEPSVSDVHRLREAAIATFEQMHPYKDRA